MIDTASVGLLSGTAQQAALNPAVSVADFAQAQDQDDGQGVDAPRTTLTLVTALKLALVVGSVFGVGLSFFGNTLLRSLIGNDSLDPAVMAAALRYVRIRCLGMPAAVVIGTAQSACLGMQDVKSPLYVLLAAAIINFCGDVIMVPNANPWLGGAAGAAWATVFSQYGALIMFWRWMTTRPKVGVDKSSYESLRLKKDRPARVKSSPKSRGFLADGKLTLRDYLSVSKIDVPTAKEFAPFVIPVTTTSIGRISGYIAMSHVASSTLGTFDMAAHQIIFSIFCCLTPIVDALSQVAQSFVPSIHGIKAKSEARANALRKTINNFRKVGACFGVLLVSLVSMIPLISRYFTSDPLVMQKVNGAIPGVALFLIVHGLMCGGEGSLLGQKDLVFLRNSYALFFFTVPAYMLRLKYRALAGLQTVGIGTMWAAFSTYNLIRTTIFHARLAQLQRRTNRQIEK
ncbi:multidrug and toxic compound extrusion (MATE) family protein [Skeletonema marinoi]|uniref:Multidrug and toxic compound extrusion (MATE) family protein n=1 Tax=Skeletonema marinoi TaxID=267567 RepID=A0AAD8Y2R7_9STRA|nr:multidrug and toxic compound extrusion (MATE) family protein [Skeletonema marinoi]